MKTHAITLHIRTAGGVDAANVVKDIDFRSIYTSARPTNDAQLLPK